MISLPILRQMVEHDHPKLSISQQCELLGLNRSGLYYEPAKESEENLSIMKMLDKQYLDTPFYGVERLLFLLRSMGYAINRKRLRRLMHLVRWQTLYSEPTTTVEPTHYKYPYLLRHMTVEHPNHVWSIDITYIPMAKGFMYLFAIIDMYSRFVINWDISNTMTSEWCVQVIRDAISQYGTPRIINSDQGSQFTSDIYVNFIKKHRIQISMDGKGRALDNIFIERLWRSVKYENVYLHAYSNGIELFAGLNKYFLFYNNDRPHQGLNYMTPRKSFENETKSKSIC